MVNSQLSFPYLRHPLVVSALILTFLNDHFLKHQFPNFLTGKISDFTGVFYFPLFIYALIVFAASPSARHTHINRIGLLLSIIFTDALFVVFKYTDARIWLSEIFNNYLFKIQITPDITDLYALNVNFITYIFARRYFKQTRSVEIVA